MESYTRPIESTTSRGKRQHFPPDSACPICRHVTRRGEKSWCCSYANGITWCGRVSAGSFKPSKGGWLHRLNDRPSEFQPPPEPAEPLPPPEKPPDFPKLARKFCRSLTDAALAQAAEKLNVSQLALRRLRIGWATSWELVDLGTKCRGCGAYTFPMEDGAGRVIGIRLRTPSGFKYSIAGTDGSGLFVPKQVANARDGLLMLPEGPTSAAALLQMGYVAVGRPNCRAGIGPLRKLIAELAPTKVVIVGDNDRQFNKSRDMWEWPGKDGADAIAAGICDLVNDGNLKVILPPEDFKDVRDWIAAGARIVHICRQTEIAPPVRRAP